MAYSGVPRYTLACGVTQRFLMNLADKLFALRQVPPFDRLHEVELALIAEAARTRVFAPGETLCGPQKPLTRLHILIEGAVTCRGTGKVARTATESASLNAPLLIGVRTLLLNTDEEAETVSAAENKEPAPAATAEGAPAEVTCLVLSQGDFYTVLNECPTLAVGLLEMANETPRLLL